MTAASIRSPRVSCSTIAASSIHGTGAQNFLSRRRQELTSSSRLAFGPQSCSRRTASSLVSPFEAEVRTGAAPGGDIRGIQPPLQKDLIDRPPQRSRDRWPVAEADDHARPKLADAQVIGQLIAHSGDLHRLVNEGHSDQ